MPKGFLWMNGMDLDHSMHKQSEEHSDQRMKMLGDFGVGGRGKKRLVA